MQTALNPIASALAGLFLGFVAGVLSFFIAELYRKVFARPKQFAAPALVLLVILGSALFYLGVIIMADWIFFIASALALLWVSKPMLLPA